MSIAEGLVKEIQATEKFFKKTLTVFEPADAEFSPKPELFTVAGHVAHVADSVDWFIEGAFGKGWNMDFESMNAKAKEVTSLDEAKEWLERAFSNAAAVVGKASDDDLMAPIEDKQIMEGAPRIAVVNGIVDHTAHHRGCLTVYARLVGKVPAMPYA